MIIISKAWGGGGGRQSKEARQQQGYGEKFTTIYTEDLSYAGGDNSPDTSGYNGGLDDVAINDNNKPGLGMWMWMRIKIQMWMHIGGGGGRE